MPESNNNPHVSTTDQIHPLTPLQIETVKNAQNLAIQYYRAGNYRDALAHCMTAADIDTTNAKLLNLAGAIATEAKEAATAIFYLKKSLALSGQQIEALFLLGNALSAQHLYEESSQVFIELLKLQPDNIDTLVNCGLCMDQTGKPAKAEQYFKKALNLNPDHPEANNALAILFNRKLRSDKAEIYARRAIKSNPDQVEYFLTLGSALHRLKNHREAEIIFRTALETHANNPTIISELASALYELGEIEKAEKQYDIALQLAPKNLKVLASAGAFYQSTRKSKKALKIYKRYLEINPADVGIRNNTGIIYRDLEMFEESEEAYLKTLSYSKDSTFILNNLAILAMEMGKPRESIDYYTKVLEIDPDYSSARSNMLFYMNYLSTTSAREIYKEHLKWDDWHALLKMKGENVHGNDISPDRKLRIGYLSADFYGHAVSYFIEAALKNHDAENFDIYCYAVVKTPDGVTKRLKSYNNTWRNIYSLTLTDIANTIREDKIDILIDLSGHTAGNRLNVFSMKPAPVQVTWIGYPNTTGLKAMDYRFVDHITDPVGLADEIHSEKLWRLPRSFTCYTPQLSLPAKTKLAAKENGYITFGSFNNATKISNACISLWARILKRIDGSRLILKSASLNSKETKDRFTRQFKKHGVDIKRIKMFGRLPSEEHLRFYDKIDICLDAYPYHGTTTSCEALYMGVPIITLMGDRHAARVTGSLLSQVGIGHLAGNTEDECIEIAAELATNLDDLERMTLGLREAMDNSPLCDAVGHTREVEDAYREMWSTWCLEEPERRAERREQGHSETLPFKAPIGLIHAFGSPSMIQFIKCLGSMNNICLLNDLHPLGMNVFSPTNMAQKYFKIFDDQEWDIISKKKFSFDEAIARIHDKVTDQNGHLVISNWCHLDYIAQPYLPTPDFEMHTPDALENRFDVSSIFLVMHPVLQWISYSTYTTIANLVSIDEFLQGYKHYAEAASKGKFYKSEDFIKSPANILKQINNDLKIPFDPEFENNWPFYFNVQGDVIPMPLETRAKEKLGMNIPLQNEQSYRKEMEGNSDYQRILELLGYE